MRAEVLDGDPHTLVVALDVSAVGDGHTPVDERLAAISGELADVVLSQTAATQDPPPARQVDAVTIRLTKTIVVAETTVPLDPARECWV
jgi:hypothetical protein